MQPRGQCHSSRSYDLLLKCVSATQLMNPLKLLSCSNYAPGVKNGPAPVDDMFYIRIYGKIITSEVTRPNVWIFDM